MSTLNKANARLKALCRMRRLTKAQQNELNQLIVIADHCNEIMEKQRVRQLKIAEIAARYGARK